jgi:hypothetical protein
MGDLARYSPLNRERTNPMPEHRNLLQHLLSENEPAHINHIAAVNKFSSIDSMFDALYQASVTQDRAALGVVAQAYLQSPDGQAFMQQGRHYNHQIEAQQVATQQNMSRSGPAMSR